MPTKDAPAFDFYPERWLSGTAEFSDGEQIAYLRLLCHQWLMDGLPDSLPALRRLGGRGVSTALLDKFPVTTDGKRRNPRLEIVRTEQRARIAKKREQRQAAANARWHPSQSAPNATAVRPHNDSTSENGADAMPTTHHPPPTPVKQQQPPPRAGEEVENGVPDLDTCIVVINARPGIPIPREVITAWYHDRAALNWRIKPKPYGPPIQLTAKNYASDLANYAHHWQRRETPPQSPVIPKPRTPITDPHDPNAEF